MPSNRTLKMSNVENMPIAHQTKGLPSVQWVKTLQFHCRRNRFNSWSGNYDPTCLSAQARNTKISEKEVNELNILNLKERKIIGPAVTWGLNQPRTENV